MKDFLKFTLATVTGIILSSIVLFIVSMVTLFGIMSASDTETIVKKNSVMMLDLNGTLVERTQENPLDILSQLFSDDSNIYGLDDILSSIKKAKENENIKGIYLQASSLGTSYASLQEIRNALLDFKESGKFIIAYGDSYTQGLYYLSSVADKVLLNPKGMIEWRGIAAAPGLLQRFAAKNWCRNANLQGSHIQIGSGTVYFYRDEPRQPGTSDCLYQFYLETSD